MYSGHLRMSEIVDRAGPVWNVIPQFPAFVVFLICALAETNRPPFDLAEAETELVAGFHTEYSGIKFAMFYLGEYVNTVDGGGGRRHAVPRRVARTVALDGAWCRGRPASCGSCSRSVCVIYVFILIRGDAAAAALRPADELRLEDLIPFGLFWVLATGAIVVLPDRYTAGGHRRSAASTPSRAR